jgi:hypothetical protein
MSSYSHCGEPGHNTRICPFDDVEKGPWFRDPDERWHTKIVTDEDGTGTSRWGREMACKVRNQLDVPEYKHVVVRLIA